MLPVSPPFRGWFAASPPCPPMQTERDSLPEGRSSLAHAAPPPAPSFFVRFADMGLGFVAHLGQIGRMTWGALKAIFKRPLEVSSTLHQMDSLGVRSAAIASVTALFVGMVMAVQFAIGLQKFGGMEYTGR